MDGFRTALQGVWSGFIASMIREAFHNTDIKIVDHTCNGLFAVHQLTAELNGVKHRIVIAPMDAPIIIGTVKADEHFGG